MTCGTKPRVLLVDDHRELLSALEFHLRCDCDVIGSAMTVAELMQKAQIERPDIIVLDYRLPDGNGIDACRQVLAALPGTAVILLTATDDEEVGKAACAAGADGLVSKYCAHSHLIPAIMAAYEKRKATQSDSAIGAA